MRQKVSVSVGLTKTQVCPHGSSFPCSQCMGYTTVQKVKYDEKNQALTIDGKVIRRGLIPSAELKSVQQDMERKMIRAASGRRETTCGICGQKGHTRKQCHARSKLLTKEPIPPTPRAPFGALNVMKSGTTR